MNIYSDINTHKKLHKSQTYIYFNYILFYIYISIRRTKMQVN